RLSKVPEVIRAAKEMHEKTPHMRIISWDFTIDSNEEIVLLEINIFGQSVWFPQLVSGKLIFGDNTEKMMRLSKESKGEISMGDSFNLEAVLKILRKNTFMIVTLTLLTGFLTAVVTIFLLTPKYEAETQILVSQPENTGTMNNQDIETSLQLIMTYRDIILSPIILEEVINNLDLNMSIRDLSEQITVSNQDQSQVITVTVTED